MRTEGEREGEEGWERCIVEEGVGRSPNVGRDVRVCTAKKER